MNKIKITQEEYDKLKRKSDKWDALNKKIGSMYYDENGEEIDPYADGGFDLCDIGEAAASN